MSTELAARRDERPERVALELRSRWPMIGSVSLRRCADGKGCEAEIRLDPVIVRGAREQQGHPSTPDAMARAEKRRFDAIAECVEAVNEKLPPSEAIRSFRVSG